MFWHTPAVESFVLLLIELLTSCTNARPAFHILTFIFDPPPLPLQSQTAHRCHVGLVFERTRTQSHLTAHMNPRDRTMDSRTTTRLMSRYRHEFLASTMPSCNYNVLLTQLEHPMAILKKNLGKHWKANHLRDLLRTFLIPRLLL